MVYTKIQDSVLLKHTHVHLQFCNLVQFDTTVVKTHIFINCLNKTEVGAVWVQFAMYLSLPITLISLL